MRTLLAALLCLGLCATATAQDVVTVSMFQLIATPERFHGKPIRVIAFFRNKFEGTVLYPHREDHDRALIPNGVWIDVPPEEPPYKELGGGYVIAEGVFDANNKGHMGMWSGALTKVSRLQKWEAKR